MPIDPHTGLEAKSHVGSCVLLSKVSAAYLSGEYLNLVVEGHEMTFEPGTGHPDCFMHEGAHPAISKVINLWLKIDHEVRMARLRQNEKSRKAPKVEMDMPF